MASNRPARHDGRAALAEAARQMGRSGLSPQRSGNISMRIEGGMLITPSALPYDVIKADDIVEMSFDGRPIAGTREPSSEWHFHLAIYKRRPDRSAVVHTHSMHATVLACAGHAIRPFHYMVAVAGGADIPLVPYATFGTRELAELVATGLAQRDACLMAHHGMVATAATLDQAMELAHTVETLAEQYYKVLLLGEPKLLSEVQIAEALKRFQTYGGKGGGHKGGGRA